MAICRLTPHINRGPVRPSKGSHHHDHAHFLVISTLFFSKLPPNEVLSHVCELFHVDVTLLLAQSLIRDIGSLLVETHLSIVFSCLLWR
jgi:hypothetical protein